MASIGPGDRTKSAVLWSIVGATLVLLAAPTVVVLGASFTAGTLIAFPPEGLSLRWYAKVLGSAPLRDAFGRSALVAVVCTLLALPAGVFAALAMARHRLRFAKTLLLWLLLPFTVPLIAAGMGLMLLYGEAGVAGALWPVGVACCVINLPFMLWAVLASVNALDPDLEHAAASCGAAPTHTFFTVTLPALMPGVITGSLLMFVLAFNEFLVSLLLTDAYTVTLPVAIYNSIRSIVTPDLAAVSVVYIAVALAAIALLDRIVGLEIFLRSK
jgi:putative spermidine/putrescine transport system permease protein